MNWLLIGGGYLVLPLFNIFNFLWSMLMKLSKFHLCSVFILGAFLFVVPSATFSASTDISYHFDKEPFIHPKIIKDLNTWLSDTGDQVISINLTDSQDSNRYSGEMKIRNIENKKPFVYVEEDKEQFGYQHIGQTDSGIHVLSIFDGGSGSGIFMSVMLVKLEEDLGLTYHKNYSNIKADKKRVLVKKMGTFALGDRYSGEIRVEGNSLVVGKDNGLISAIFESEKVIRID